MYLFKSCAVGTLLVVLLFSNAHSFLAASICRRLLIQAFICAVSRALTKLGMAIAIIIGIKIIAHAIPRYPVTKPPIAKPWPEILPPEYLIRESALCPQITPGIAAKIEKQARLKIPSTRLQTARAEVLGGVLIVIGGMASFIT